MSGTAASSGDCAIVCGWVTGWVGPTGLGTPNGVAGFQPAPQPPTPLLGGDATMLGF